MNIYYVYAYFCPDTNRILYVGKGKGGRRFDHLRAAKEGKKHSSNQHWHDKLKVIVSQGKEPIISKLVEHLSSQDALDLETELIKLHGRRDYDEGGILYNVCLYASDWTGMKHTEEAKRKLSIAHTGKKLSSEHIEKVRQAVIGTKHPPRSAEWKAKQRASHLGLKDPNNPNRVQSGAKNNNAKTWVLEREDGSIFEVRGLKPWCKERGLSFDAVCRRDGRWFDGVRLIPTTCRRRTAIQ